MDGTSIPASLKPYFQEYNLEDLSIRRDPDLIIQSTLEFGNWDEIRCILSNLCSQNRAKCALNLTETQTWIKIGTTF